METIITNKEETLEFTYMPEVKQYRIKALPKHPHYDKFKGKGGCSVADPNCIGYDCWVSGGCVVKGKILDGTIILIGKYGGAIDEGCIIKDSYVDAGGLFVFDRSEINDLTVLGEDSAEVRLSIRQSILSAKVNVWLNLSMNELSEMCSIKITNSIISGTTTTNSSNLIIEDSNLSGGPFIISRDMRSIKGVFEPGPFEFNKKEEYGS